MEITKANFYETLPRIKKAIDDADFIAIDCELSGLNTGSEVNAFDTQRQYYEKVRKSSREFIIIQYGLCTFRCDSRSQSYKHQAYNFYVFLRPLNKYIPDVRFLCQASSIDFLATQGFDFNKLFKEGISYLNSHHEDKYRKKLDDNQKNRANQLQNSFSSQNEKEKANHILAMTAEEKTFVDKIITQIEAFVNSKKNEQVLPRCNAYLRRLVYQEFHRKLENRAILETRVDNKERILVITKPKCRAEKEQEEKRHIDIEEEEFTNSVGFSEVIKHLTASGKLIVGHNMFLDILHTIDKFLTPLPDDYDEFKDAAHCLFSNLLDTKFMSSSEPFRKLIDSTVLSHLIKSVSQDPFSIPNVESDDEGCSYKLDPLNEHEAGYDAYITGLCFLAMWKYLGNTDNVDEDTFLNLSLVNPYKNRLFLMRLQDCQFLHLGAQDPTPSRDHVLYLTFPKEWKLNDIVQLFSPFGNVYVAWIDDTSAYVALQKRDQTHIALNTLSQSDTYTVMTYAKRQMQLVENSSAHSVIKRKLSEKSVAIKKQRTCLGESSDGKRKRSCQSVLEGSGTKFPEDDVGVPIAKTSLVLNDAKKVFTEVSWD